MNGDKEQVHTAFYWTSIISLGCVSEKVLSLIFLE